jgi:hypothetical protein
LLLDFIASGHQANHHGLGEAMADTWEPHGVIV